MELKKHGTGKHWSSYHHPIHTRPVVGSAFTHRQKIQYTIVIVHNFIGLCCFYHWSSSPFSVIAELLLKQNWIIPKVGIWRRFLESLFHFWGFRVSFWTYRTIRNFSPFLFIQLNSCMNLRKFLDQNPPHLLSSFQDKS